MASETTPHPLSESTMTIQSDSEHYSASSPQDDLSSSPPSSQAPLILYKPPTLWGILRGAAINLLLPFINGLALGFGELFAHEFAFRLGWSGTKVISRRRKTILDGRAARRRANTDDQTRYSQLGDLGIPLDPESRYEMNPWRKETENSRISRAWNERDEL